MQGLTAAADRGADDLRRPRADQLRCRSTACDARAAFYTALADDSAQADGTREAALLFSVAEGHFRDGGSTGHEEAFRAAEEAFASAKASGDLDLWADAARIVVKGYCLRAYNNLYERGSSGAAEAESQLDRARDFAESQRQAFQEAGCVRGEAAMRLSAAEVLLEDRDLDDRMSALQPALESQGLCQRLGDKKLEAASLLALADVYALDKDRRRSQEAAESARELFRLAEDPAGEARALHALAMASAMEGSFASNDSGLRLAQEAVSLFDAAGCRGLQAMELLTVADFNFTLGRSKLALQASKEALRIFRQTGHGRGSEGYALALVVEAHIELDQLNTAVDLAKETLARFSKQRDRRQEVAMHDVLVHAQLAMGDAEGALDTAQAGLALCPELQDYTLEANLLMSLSEVHLELQNAQEALTSAEDASSIFRALDHEWLLAGYAQYQVAKLCAATGDVTRALEESQLARDFFYKINNHRCEGMALLQAAGIISMSPDRFQEAVKVAEQALDVFEKAEDRGGKALGLHIAAELQRTAGHFVAARELALVRRKLLQELGFAREEAKALHAIAAIHLANQDAAEAGRAAREGLRLARAAADRTTEVHMLLQVTQACLQLAADSQDVERGRKFAEDGLKASRDAVAISRKVAGGRLRAPALFWSAHAMALFGMPGECLEAVEDATRLFRAARERSGEGQALLLAAQVHSARGQGPRAEALCREATALFNAAGDAEGRELAAEVLRRVAPNVEHAQQQQQQQQQQQPQQLELPIAESMASEVAAAPQGLDIAAARQQIMQIALDTIGENDGVELDSPLMDMGLDSLSSVSLRNDLAKEFKVSLAASVMFDYPSVSSLADHIAEKAGG